jgi:4-oxalocrotonate tautomerase
VKLSPLLSKNLGFTKSNWSWLFLRFYWRFLMPLVRIDVPVSTSAQEVAAISDAIHLAMTNTFNVPLGDRFQTITRRARDELICTAEFLDVKHTDEVVFVQITCAPGRSIDTKKLLYKKIAEQIAAVSHISVSDVVINLVESSRENWSFGNGIAQYALAA